MLFFIVYSFNATALYLLKNGPIYIIWRLKIIISFKQYHKLSDNGIFCHINTENGKCVDNVIDLQKMQWWFTNHNCISYALFVVKVF